MKKLFFISLSLLSACGAKTDLQSVEWKKGQSSEALRILQGIEISSAAQIKSSGETVDLQEQKISGVSIENTYVKKIQNKSGENVQVRAAISDDPEKLSRLPIKKFLDKKTTIRQELMAAFPVLRKQGPEAVEVIIAHRRGFYEPLWRVVYTDAKGIPWEIRVNNDLQVQSVKRVGSQFHDTLAVIFPRGPKKSSLQEVVLKGLNLNPTLSSPRLFVSSQADDRITTIGDSLKFNPQDARFDQVQVFFFLEESLAWFERKLGIKIPFQLNAEVHVGAPEKTNSAFYYQGKIRIGSGDDETYSRIPQDPTIVVHESVHALVDTVARLPFEGEGGSINEGFADFFTAVQLGNPHMGDSAYLKGPFRRSVVNTYKLSDKNGGLYHDSGIISGTLWDFVTRFGSERGTRVGIRTLNRLVPGSDFNDFGNTLREVVKEEFATAEELTVAQDILTGRGF